MKISDWLDEKMAEGMDVTRVTMPPEMSYDQSPDEMVYFKEHKPCGYFCAQNHPFSKVERFGNWYACKGQDRKAGIHCSDMTWHLFTKDKQLALKTAKAHMG
jgi:hypothetical protein